MKFGIEEVIHAKKPDKSIPLYGMPEIHINAMRQSSAELNMPILIRPVNPLSTYFLANGYPTKDFYVKNKTSRITFTAGLIPIDSHFSHIPESNAAVHDENIKKALAHGYVTTSLILPFKRVDELEKLGLFEKKETSPGKFLVTWQKNNGTEDQKMEAFAKINASGEYEFFDKDDKPIEVLAKKIEEIEKPLPVTADYDIFAALVDFKVFSPGGKDKSPLRTQGSLETLDIDIHDTQRSSYTGPKENEERGNVSKRMLEVIQTINRNIPKFDLLRDKKGLETVHHNAETQNPFASVIGDNIPILMVLPTKLNLDELSDNQEVDVVLIETVEEAISLYEKMAEKGYYWAQHAKIPEFRRINAIKEKIMSSLPPEATSTLSRDITENIHEAREKKIKEKEKEKEITSDKDKEEDQEKEKKRLLPRFAVFARSVESESTLVSTHAIPTETLPSSDLTSTIASLETALQQKDYSLAAKDQYREFIDTVSELKEKMPPQEWQKLDELAKKFNPILIGFYESQRKARK